MINNYYLCSVNCIQQGRCKQNIITKDRIMFYKLIEKKRNEWLASENCTIKNLFNM